MRNPIPKSDFFATMSMSQIQDFISAMPKDQQANANLVLMFTLNACHQAVEKAHVEGTFAC